MLTKSQGAIALRSASVAWILAICAGLPGCASSGSHQRTNLKTPFGDITIDTQAGQFHVKIGANQHGKITFKDSDGNTIPGGIEGDGPIDADFPLPEGYASYDYTVSDKPAPAPAPVPVKQDRANPSNPSNPTVTSVTASPRARNWMVNCTSNFLDDTTLHGFCYQVSTKSANEAGAWSKFDAVAAAGPGGAVPAGVQIDAWVDVQAGPSYTTISSALRDSFASYQITVDGVVVADSARGLNAVLMPLGNGWNRISSALPNSLAGSRSDVILTQKGAANGAAEATLEIGNL